MAGVISPFGSGASPVNAAQAYGLSFMTVDPVLCGAGNNIPAQLMLAILVRAIKSETINKLGTWIKTAGVTAGAGINGIALYSAAGVLLGQTGDMTAAFQVANSYQEGTIAGGVAVAANTDYYLCFLANFTGTQVVVPGTNTTANVPSIRSVFTTLTLAAQAVFPASFTPSALALNNGSFFLSAGT